MPGICGIISRRPKELNEEELAVMAGAMHMEPFYGSGRASFPEMGVCVAWTSIQGSFSDCMPVLNEKGDVTLIYSGENFRDLEDLDRLKGRNHRFAKTNASYIVHMYEEWDIDFLPMLNGRGQGLIIDERKKRSILFNDRYGLKGLYYWEDSDAFYFSSEAKAILKILPGIREIDPLGLAEFFLHGYALGHRSLFKGIHLLPAASRWEFVGSEPAGGQQAYFDAIAELEDQPLLEKEFHYERLRSLFQKILDRYYRTEDNVSFPLTGDPENLVILANAKCGSGRLPCCSLGISPFDVDSLTQAASSVDQSLQIAAVDTDFREQMRAFSERAVYISDGNMIVTGAILLYFHSKAREIAAMQLSSDCGDFLLRNLSLLHLNRLDESIFDNDFRIIIRETREAYESLKTNNRTFALMNLLEGRERGRLGLQESQTIVRTPFLDNDFVKLLYRATDDTFDDDTICRRLIGDANPALLRILPEPSHVSRLEGAIHRFFGSPKSVKESGSFYDRLVYMPVGPLMDEYLKYWKEMLFDGRSVGRSYLKRSAVEKKLDGMGGRSFVHEMNFLITAEYAQRLFIDT